MTCRRAKIIGISRHRLVTDGEGVTTLVAFHGCPLNCRYCLNPQSLGDDTSFLDYSPAELYTVTRVDELYFLATNGGITFGGGEPCLRASYISEFRDICGPEWKLYVETSLNVPTENITKLLPVIDGWIVDIKDLNPDIYRRYTGRDNARVLANLLLIAHTGRQAETLIRLPLIPNHNTEAERKASRVALEQLGFTRFDLFTYLIHEH